MNTWIGMCVIATIFSCQIVSADGIPFEGNRVQGRTTTIISLTDAQKTQLENPNVWKILLTRQQQRLVEQEAGFAPAELHVYSLKSAQNTCTCEVINIGIRFMPDQLEIPHDLLGKHLDDRFKTKAERVAETRLIGKGERQNVLEQHHQDVRPNDRAEANFQAEFDTLFQQHAYEQLEPLLQEWVSTSPDDPEVYLGYFNFYVHNARREYRTFLPVENPEDATNFEVDKETGHIVTYLSSEITSNVVYNQEEITKGLHYIDRSLQKFPRRFDMHLGKLIVLMEAERYADVKDCLIRFIEMVMGQIRHVFVIKT